jgi:hypothetical protein
MLSFALVADPARRVLGPFPSPVVCRMVGEGPAGRSVGLLTKSGEGVMRIART